MLVYHPMFDPYHCALRLASIFNDGGVEDIELDKLRLLDFYVVFPSLLKTLRMPKVHAMARKMLRSIPRPYETLANPPRLFFQLNQIQEPAIRMLAAHRIIQKQPLVDGVVTVDCRDQLEKVAAISNQLSSRQTDWYRFIVQDLMMLPVNGKDGLKDRSGLMEFRHDPV